MKFLLNILSSAIVAIAILSAFSAFSQTPDWNTAGNAIGSTEVFGSTSAQNLNIITSNSQRMIIKGDGTNNGFVGIGLTTPVNLLDIEGNAAIGATYSGSNTAPTNGLIVEGNVGIGSPSPLQKLDINGNLTISSNSWYGINNARILSNPGTNNIYVGISTIAANSLILKATDGAFF